jgi:Ser/Thr protein kinase RdoA (MazF antagonist)
MQAVPEALLAEVRDRYGIVAGSTEAVGGGTASKLWRLDAEPPVVVRLAQYYQLADQRWSCRVAAEFAAEIPEAIAPLKGADGESVFLWQGQPITVWPFVMGAPLNLQSPAERRQAARLLARLHKSARAFPSLGEGKAPERDDTEAKQLLPDDELDEWLQAWQDRSDEQVGWIHRDFFPGNVLCQDGQIVGLVDWDEVEWSPLINELAWSVWEFGKSPAGDALVLDHALEFLTEYERAGGPLRPSNALIPLMRARLRSGIAFWRRVEAADPLEDEAQVAAFSALRHVRLLR